MSKWTDEEIRKLCEEATPGPWEWEKYDVEIAPGAVVASAGWLELPLVYTQQGVAFHLEDVEFIAAARELVPQLLERTLKAEAELRRCYKDMEELTAERNDLKAMLADAGIRNGVLEKRLDTIIDYCDREAGGHDFCHPLAGSEHCYSRLRSNRCDKECWYEWLEQEVQL